MHCEPRQPNFSRAHDPPWSLIILLVTVVILRCVRVLLRDHYITMVRWRDNSHVMVAWSNRAQNHTVLTLCNAYSTDCQLVL